MTGVEIRELRAFVCVVDEGGVSAAARRLHVSQSALSQTIRMLERRLGVQVLTRDHTGARPTAAGDVLLTGARDLLDRHDRLLVAMTGPGREDTTVRIGLPLELPAHVLPAVLGAVTFDAPGTKAEVVHSSSSEQLGSLRSGDLDLALVRDRPADDALDAVLVLEEPLGVLLAAGTAERLAGPGGVPLERLGGLAWIGFPRAEAPAWYDQVVATFRGHGLPLPDHRPPYSRSAILEVKLAGVISGAHFALAPPESGAPLPAGVQWHPLAGTPLVRRTWAVWAAASRSRGLAAVVAALEARRW